MAHAFDFDLVSEDRYMSPEQAAEAIRALEDAVEDDRIPTPEELPPPSVETTLVAFEPQFDEY